MNAADDAFVSWAAGFFDGEGNVDIRYRKTHGGLYERFEARCTVTQRAERPLVMLRERWGGSIVRPVSGLPRWVCTSSAALRFLLDVRPYLVVKADQTDVAIEFLRLSASTGPATRAINQNRRGFAREPVELRERKLALHLAIRKIRVDEGAAPRSNRVVPESLAA